MSLQILIWFMTVRGLERMEAVMPTTLPAIVLAPEHHMLSSEEARQALIDMIDSRPSERYSRQVRDRLRTDDVQSLAPDKVRIGRWLIDLKNGSFSWFLDVGPVMHEWRGEFKRDERGNWKARVTEKIHASK